MFLTDQGNNYLLQTILEPHLSEIVTQIAADKAMIVAASGSGVIVWGDDRKKGHFLTKETTTSVALDHRFIYTSNENVFVWDRQVGAI